MKRSSNAIDHRVRVGRQRSARTESRIVEAALRVFAQWGPDAPVIDDFVKAAGVARGTFYNHFTGVEELLQATSACITRDMIHSIEEATAGIEGPALRFGVGLRLFFIRAQRDPVWSRFVARVWKVGGLELPVRDLDQAIRRGHLRVPGREVAHDFLFGGIREAMHRIGEGHVDPSFGDQMTEMCLQALRAEPHHIAAVLDHELPALTQRPRDGAARGRASLAG